MHKDELLGLRKQIIESAQNIALNGSGSLSERLEILLGVIRSGDADINLLTKTFEIIQQLETDDDRLSGLLDLLYEVDADISKIETKETQPDVDNQANSDNEQQES